MHHLSFHTSSASLEFEPILHNDQVINTPDILIWFIISLFLLILFSTHKASWKKEPLYLYASTDQNIHLVLSLTISFLNFPQFLQHYVHHDYSVNNGLKPVAIQFGE